MNTIHRTSVFVVGGILATLGLTSREQPEPVNTETIITTTTTTTTTTTVPVPVATVKTTATRGATIQIETTTTIPQPKQWTGPIPAHYGPGSECTPEQATIIATAFWDRNASDDTVLWALGMISRESTCDSAAHNGNRNTGDDSWGLCQLNVLAGHFSTNGILHNYDRHQFANNFAYNAEACATLWAVCGQGPWNYGNYYCQQPTS